MVSENGGDDRRWVEVTCYGDPERVFVTADDGPFARRTEPFEEANNAPYTEAELAMMQFHVRQVFGQRSAPPNPIPVVMMLVAVAMMLLVVFR